MSTAASPGYYAVIPAQVRYDPELRPNAKLLYGELTALAGPDGYCWASDKYFAELYGLSRQTVSELVRSLVRRGYIHVEMGANSRGRERHIYAGAFLVQALGGDSRKNPTIPAGGLSEKPDNGLSDFSDLHKDNNLNKINNPPVSPQGGEDAGELPQSPPAAATAECAPATQRRVPSRKEAPSGREPCEETSSVTPCGRDTFPKGEGKKRRAVFEAESNAYKCAVYLDRRIRERLPEKPEADERTKQRWADAFDKCHRIDGYSWDVIGRVLRFSQTDPFWRQNILSGRNFRDKFLKLYAHADHAGFTERGSERGGGYIPEVSESW